MFADFIAQVIKWADNEPLIDAVILIGSYVRGTQKADSDIDLVILTSDKQHYIDNTKLLCFYDDYEKSAVEFYGECTSVRMWYKSGLEVEFGFVSLRWIDLPLDDGTKRALTDGYKILIDKRNVFLPVIPIIPEYKSILSGNEGSKTSAGGLAR
jgi:predicted nucleotidyltransferase